MIGLAFGIATLADIPALHGLIERAYRGDSAREGWTHEADLLGGQRTDAATLASLIDDPDQRMIMAKSAMTLQGCVQIARGVQGTAYLGHLSVEPHLQGRGIGRQLLAFAERLAIDEFVARRMEMTVIKQRSELIEWYGRQDYVPSGEERPFPVDDRRFGHPKIDGLAFVVLTKPLGKLPIIVGQG